MLATPTTSTAVQKPATAVNYASDFRNTLTGNSGPEHQLVLSEGAYLARDEITLGTVPAHPNYQQSASTNVLDTRPLPPSAAPVVSTTAIPPPSQDAPFEDVFQLSSSDKTFGASPSPQTKSTSTSRFKYLATGNLKAYVGVDAANNSQTTAKEPKEAVKRRKPKNSIVRSNSSLISRAMPHENLTRRLNDRNPGDAMAFVNNSRSFLWLDLASPQKADQLTKIMFTKGNPLCHHVNPATTTLAPKQFAHIDVVAGFSTADIMWYEPFSQKYSRLNKRGMINEFPISSIKWIPGSESLFVAAHYDGSLIIYDKERDDAAFVPEEDASKVPVRPIRGRRPTAFEVKKSQKSKTQKTNPVAYFSVTKKKINAIECSPDGRFVAVAGEDGSLRIVDLMREELTDVYWSYYGGLTCISWSPDSKYLLTGGQDDLVSIWSFEDRSIVARCTGHRSWVSSVAFDPWRCDGVTYRFGSVGQDCRLLLYDYSGSLVSSKANGSIRPSVSSSANLPETANGQTIDATSSEESARDSTSEDLEDSIFHAAEPRAAVTWLPPVFSKTTGEHPMSWLGFQETTIMTADAGGHIRTYDRPEEGGVASDGQNGEVGQAS